MSNSYQPVITTYPDACPVSVAELRTHLQLYGDTSYDDELQMLLFTAQEFVSDFIGQPISATTIKIAFKGWNTRIQIKHVNLSSFSVSYYNDQNSEIDLVFNTDFVLDSTGKYPEVSFLKVPTDLSTDYAHPGKIEYATNMQPIPPTVRHAILLGAAEMFETRTESQERAHHLANITIGRLLQSHKRQDY